MSNYNFYNNFDTTFQNACVPPPPCPPSYFIAPYHPMGKSDRDIVQDIERRVSIETTGTVKSNVSISQVKDRIHGLLLTLNKIKEKETILLNKINDLTDNEWNSNIKEIERYKMKIQSMLFEINNLNIDVLRKLLMKRAAKRARLKRLRFERKREKEERIRETKEKSRKIDENLQKIKDEIEKIKQEEESKIKADAVLKETLRKKSDAKKCIMKLEALVRLRRARLNTAKGRGETFSENEATIFETNIDKLKSLWTQKLTQYDKEEADLRHKLQQDCEKDSTLTSERDVTDSLIAWKTVLFGGETPQCDFNGNMDAFVNVRSQWDQYISPDGTTLPMGWVVPSNTYTQG